MPAEGSCWIVTPAIGLSTSLPDSDTGIVVSSRPLVAPAVATGASLTGVMLKPTLPTAVVAPTVAL